MKNLRIGVSTAYYGTAHPSHIACCRELLKAGIPVFQVQGSAYPEMARAEVCRQALKQRPDVIVFLDANVVATPETIRAVAEYAYEEKALVSVSGFPEGEDGVGARPWAPGVLSDMAFAALTPDLLQKIAAADPRGYTNTCIVDSEESRAVARTLFSPWQAAPGTLETPPIAPGVWCDPDRAFLMRAAAQGKVLFPSDEDEDRFPCRVLGGTGPLVGTIRVAEGDAKKRAEYGIKTNYAVCVPTFGGLDLEQQAALWELEKAGVTILELRDCPHVDLARGALVKKALELGSDGVFFIDHDILFVPKDLLDLCTRAEELQDVVAGIYCMRKSAHSLIGAPIADDDSKVTFFDGGGLYPALYVGMGFCAIPKAVFLALDEKLPELDSYFGMIRPYFALDTNTGFYAGEDVSFCSRVQGLAVRATPRTSGPSNLDWAIERRQGRAMTGHRVVIDTRPRIFHMGKYHYGIEDHSVIVPRYGTVEATLTRTREEALDFLRTADQMPLHVKERTLGLDEGAAAPHGVLR